MNLVEKNDFTREMSRFSETYVSSFKKPDAVVVLSPHWVSRNETLVTSSSHPKQVYDFYGFPGELYSVAYHPP